MREALVEVARRMKDGPETIADLTRRRAEASDALHRALDEVRRIEIAVAGEVAAAVETGRPKFGNEATRNAEAQRRLSANQAYWRAQSEVTRLREELRGLDAELELAKTRFRADNNLVFLAACLIQANRLEDAEAVFSAYGGQVTPEAEAPVQVLQTGEVQAGSLEAGVFLVLEARTNDRGVVRAYCQAEDGSKVAVFGKNGTGQVLSAAVGKKVQVKYRRGDKGLIAVDVRPAA